MNSSFRARVIPIVFGAATNSSRFSLGLHCAFYMPSLKGTGRNKKRKVSLFVFGGQIYKVSMFHCFVRVHRNATEISVTVAR